jgi:hypothetical protein
MSTLLVDDVSTSSRQDIDILDIQDIQAEDILDRFWMIKRLRPVPGVFRDLLDQGLRYCK